MKRILNLPLMLSGIVATSSGLSRMHGYREGVKPGQAFVGIKSE
jgi:hypothetical protein